MGEPCLVFIWGPTLEIVAKEVPQGKTQGSSSFTRPSFPKKCETEDSHRASCHFLWANFRVASETWVVCVL